MGGRRGPSKAANAASEGDSGMGLHMEFVAPKSHQHSWCRHDSFIGFGVKLVGTFQMHLRLYSLVLFRWWIDAQDAGTNGIEALAVWVGDSNVQAKIF